MKRCRLCRNPIVVGEVVVDDPDGYWAQHRKLHACCASRPVEDADGDTGGHAVKGWGRTPQPKGFLSACEKRVACPFCYAEAGYACRGDRGVLASPHRQRIEADRQNDRVTA